MTNAPGYFYNEREERINTDSDDYKYNPNRSLFDKQKLSFDINRDFPYN